VDHLGVVVARELDPMQVLINDLSKYVLALADHDELACAASLEGVPLAFGEVVENLRPIRVEGL
jgi:hypothetical protein